jgi:hypothetical protein
MAEKMPVAAAVVMAPVAQYVSAAVARDGRRHAMSAITTRLTVAETRNGTSERRGLFDQNGSASRAIACRSSARTVVTVMVVPGGLYRKKSRYRSERVIFETSMMSPTRSPERSAICDPGAIWSTTALAMGRTKRESRNRLLARRSLPTRSRARPLRKRRARAREEGAALPTLRRDRAPRSRPYEPA